MTDVCRRPDLASVVESSGVEHDDCAVVIRWRSNGLQVTRGVCGLPVRFARKTPIRLGALKFLANLPRFSHSIILRKAA